MSTRYYNHGLIKIFLCSHRGVDPLRLAWILPLTATVLSLGCSRKPPDLNACTRIEVHYNIGSLDYFIPSTAGQNSLLSEEERKSIKSLNNWTVTDQQLIKAFAYDVSQGPYSGKLRDNAESPGGVDVVCWCGDQRVASFTVYAMIIVTADKRKFKYSPGMPDLEILAPPAIKPMEARWECAWNLSKLLFEGLEHRPGRLYPDPNRWGDEIAEFLRSQKTYYSCLKDTTEYLRSDASIARLFACPSIHVSNMASDAHANLAKQIVLIWRSDYAMNANCKKKSPDDMVFLFESKSGWNKYGGPELFTFDNHEPRGGCVVLNEGTVKFIRTEEALQQLRWK